MKKILSLFMSLVMLLSITAGLNLTANAEDGIKSINYKPIANYEYVENTHGYEDYNDEKEYWHYSFYVSELQNGDILSVEKNDGSIIDYVNKTIWFDDEDCIVDENDNWSYSQNAFVSSGGDYIFCDDLLIDSNQNNEPWEIGDHYFNVYYKGFSAQIPVKIIENPVESISLSMSNPVLTQGIDSRVYTKEDGTAFDNYSPENSIFTSGDFLTITYKDGSTEKFTYNSDSSYYDFVSESGKTVFADEAHGEDLDNLKYGGLSTSLLYFFDFDQSDTPMISGKEYPLTFAYMGSFFTANVKINKSDISSMNFVNETALELKKGENSSVRKDSGGNDYDHYYITTWEKSPANCPLVVTKKDGSSKNYSGISFEKCYYTGDYDFTCDLDSQQYENHWNVGETYSVRFWYTTDIYLDLKVKIIDDSYVDNSQNNPSETTLPSETSTQPVQNNTAPQTDVTTTTAPVTPITPAPTAPTTSAPTTKKAQPAGAKKVDGVWVNKKYKKPTISKLAKAKKSFKITWKKVSGVSGYQIQYATDKKFKKNKKTVTVKGNKSKKPSKTIKKLKSKKTYYVRIRTYKTVKVNGKATKVYSSWSKAKSVKIK